MKSSLLVGIDPGTTTAWAILNLSGDILQIGSSKELGIGGLISVVSSFGKPLIVGCDKKNIPHFVQEFSRKWGAKVISPPQDLHVSFKRQICQGTKTNNQHEIDALASARFALSRIQPLLSKIINVQHRMAPDISIDDIADIVLKTGLSIQGTLELLSQEELLAQTPPEPLSKKTIAPTRTLLSLLRSSQRNIQLLQQHNENLNQRLKHTTLQITALQHHLERKTSPSSTPTKVLLSHKEATISSLQSTINTKEGRIHNLEATLIKLEHVLSSPSAYLVANILPDLTKESLQTISKQKPLSPTSALFIDNPKRKHTEVINELSTIQPLLLCDELVHGTPLTFIEVHRIPRLRLQSHIIFAQQPIHQQLFNKGIIHRVISEYHQERGQSTPSASLKLP